MAKVSNKELNECIAQAISEVIKEDWEDDVVNAALNDKRAKKAFEKDKKKEDDAEAADDEKIENAAAADVAQAEDEDGEDSSTPSNGAYSDVRSMSYDELKNILSTEKRGTAIFRAATRELMDRNAILKDKEDILSGELVMPYGWRFDDNGYPVRTHEFGRPSSNDIVDITNSNGTNFHWLKTPMSARGGKNPKYADEPEVGMQNADWA